MRPIGSRMHVVPDDVSGMPDKDADTVRFKVAQGRMLYEMAFRFGLMWIFVLAGIVVAGIVASFFDMRFLIVALMIVLIIIPMLMAVFYLSYGLRPECFVNSVPHTLRLTDDGVEATLVFTSVSLEGDEIIEKVRRILFDYNEIGSLSVGGSDTVAVLRKPLLGFIVIPRNVFVEKEDYYTFTRNLRERMGLSTSVESANI